MISISIKSVETVINSYSSEIKIQADNALKNLIEVKKKFSKNFDAVESKYLDEIIDLFVDESMITASPAVIDSYMKSIGKVPIKVLPKKKGRPPKNLKEHIVEALEYKKLRSNFYPKYFRDIGIKTCVYCNSQLAVSIDVFEFLVTKTNTEVKAKFQVDHHHPKSEYPFLSISMFNLYPVCASCNISKSKTGIKFDLYTQVVKKSEYEFKLVKGSIAKYLINRDVNELKVQFIDQLGSFQKMFDIEGIYQTQMDIVQELIMKVEVYDISYRQNLISSFPKLFTHSSLSNRFFVGNYCEPEEIHLRPLAKFTQDIARQLKLI